ncbi:MAG: tRNA pseudouridine(38-40) synthase TruA [Pseudomonadota bacterium]
MRIAAIVEYDGSGFSGWQRQDDVPTVQQSVEEALTRIAAAEIRVVTAGRTDAGVHASAQVIHFDTHVERTPRAWAHGANSYLPPGVAILWAGRVADDFHARYSATGREYRYVILNRSIRPTYLARRVTHEYRPLDVARMQVAARSLVGTHDFTSFRAVECQAKSPVRELRRLEISRQGELVIVHVAANAFLHHMVRNLAGLLMAIGAGEHAPEWARDVLDARDRTVGDITASPDGLYLSRIDYPPAFGIPRSDAAPLIESLQPRTGPAIGA